MLPFIDPLRLAKLSGLRLRVRHALEGMLAGRHASPYRGHSIEFAEHREYAFGDEPRRIDWKVFARSDRFFVKQFQDETNVRAYLLLDASGSMGFSSRGAETKLSYAAALTGALAYILLRQEDAVALGIFDRAVRSFIPPSHQLAHLSLLFDGLERASAGGETGIAAVVKEFGRHLRRRGLVIVVSDLMDDPSEVLATLKYFRCRRHEIIVVQVLDPAEMLFPYSGERLFSHLESDRTIAADTDGVAGEYRTLFQHFMQEYKSGFRQAGIDYHVATTEMPVETVLGKMLSRR